MRLKNLIPWAVRSRLGKWFRRARPFNWRTGNYQPEAIAQQVDYALSIARNSVNWLSGRVTLRGKNVLELGPGLNFGAAFYLTAHGASVTVADAFLAPWNADYHPAFYRAFLDRLRRDEPHLDTRALATVVDAGRYPDGLLGMQHCGAENLTLGSESVDITISNAVLEHLQDHPRALRQLARVTKKGGWGFHQVDFRFHPHWDRPLDHLLYTTAEFANIATRCHQECGTTLRPFEMTTMFKECGFADVEFLPNDFPKADYFQAFLTRLQRRSDLPYARTSAELLRPIGGLFIVRK